MLLLSLAFIYITPLISLNSWFPSSSILGSSSLIMRGIVHGSSPGVVSIAVAPAIIISASINTLNTTNANYWSFTAWNTSLHHALGEIGLMAGPVEPAYFIANLRILVLRSILIAFEVVDQTDYICTSCFRGLCNLSNISLFGVSFINIGFRNISDDSSYSLSHTWITAPMPIICIRSANIHLRVYRRQPTHLARCYLSKLKKC